MARILVHVEGETEETFVKEVLAPHLLPLGHFAEARLMGNARLRSRRGGIRPWPPTLQDIVRHLTGDQGVIVTTMVDYYALPQSGPGAWPGRAEAANLSFPTRASTICSALSADVAAAMGHAFNQSRFLPYVMMHEFEAMLFSDCDRFAHGIGQPHLASRFRVVREKYTSPEEINDSPITAPSKQVIGILPNYQKPFHGNLAILEIGLDRIRSECRTFDEWISRLEQLC